MIAEIVGAGDGIDRYRIPDREMAAGSTLGSAKAALVIKATGALEKVHSCDAGVDVVGALVVHHWDGRSGIPLQAKPGEFVVEVDRQAHEFVLANGVRVTERIFMLNTEPRGRDRRDVDPPAAYYAIELRNDADTDCELDSLASIRLRGGCEGKTRVEYDRGSHALIVRNDYRPELCRIVACSVQPQSYEVTPDKERAIAQRFPGSLSDRIVEGCDDPIGIFHVHQRLRAGRSAYFYFVITFSLDGEAAARRIFASLPEAEPAMERTRRHFLCALDRALVMSPEPQVNNGALWAKANMLRCQRLTDQGWCFVNDPTRSHNSVARDTCWYAFAADYVWPKFARDSLLWYAEHLTGEGMAVEFYDIRNGKSETYGLSMNDNTPLLVLALWHHYCVTGDRGFLERVAPKARAACEYALRQRGERGLVWARADGVGNRGIVGWRNAIVGYHLDGATTELNSECYAALRTMAMMGRELGDLASAERFDAEADALRKAINDHLLDRTRKLYYLAIGNDGSIMADVTCDLVFPVMFGVAEPDVASHIITTLSRPEFWTDAGLHTVPRTAIDYGPAHGFGLLGGVWGGPTFWFAAAAAQFNPAFMAYALTASFAHYAADPRRYNTVPGQYCEWLHGETLTNNGMMLSPWFAPKYLWAAIERAAGLDVTSAAPALRPNIPSEWSWIGVRNAMVRGRPLSWFAVRLEDLTTFASSAGLLTGADREYDQDISSAVAVDGDRVMHVALKSKSAAVVMVGNTLDHTHTTSVAIPQPQLFERWALRSYDSLAGAWSEWERVDSAKLRRGLPLEVGRKGFCLLEFSKDGP